VFNERFASLLLWFGALRREDGQTLGEYALLISLVAVAVTATALIAFRDQFAAGYDSMSDCLQGLC
jgi:Flp pilus assembly pilin Flp